MVYATIDKLGRGIHVIYEASKMHVSGQVSRRAQATSDAVAQSFIPIHGV